MDINIALNNFKRAYNDLIGALEEQTESDVTLNHYEVTSDIGKFHYFAKNETHAKNQFRADHGFNCIRINRVKELQTNVDNGKHL